MSGEVSQHFLYRKARTSKYGLHNTAEGRQHKPIQLELLLNIELISDSIWILSLTLFSLVQCIIWSWYFLFQIFMIWLCWKVYHAGHKLLRCCIFKFYKFIWLLNIFCFLYLVFLFFFNTLQISLKETLEIWAAWSCNKIFNKNTYMIGDC